jgi:hypothetical protein
MSSFRGIVAAVALVVTGIAAGVVVGTTVTAASADDGLMNAFDTCETPSLAEMAAWRGASPYRAVGIYIGGAARACTNAALTTPAWVNAVTAQGWKILPIYVGPQAPCTTFKVRMGDTSATADGVAAADDAVARAVAAGLHLGSPIYADIESYVGDGTCHDVVRSFLAGWTSELHARGFRSGLYGNFNAAIAAEAGAVWRGELPVDGVWFAWWTGTPQLTGVPGLPDTSWDQHQRVHQWAGDHKETWGGVTLEIDSNLVDGMTAS